MILLGPFTALLPTNDAFNDLDPAFLDDLLLPENMEELRNFLLHHILPGATLTTEFTAGQTDTLFTGGQIDVGVDPIRFDQAMVLTPDIQACNGYIDVIDTVLNPFQDPVCQNFTFKRRTRRLQNEGENCNDNKNRIPTIVQLHISKGPGQAEAVSCTSGYPLESLSNKGKNIYKQVWAFSSSEQCSYQTLVTRKSTAPRSIFP